MRDGMRLKYRPFHWPAMSGIMPQMVAAYESYLTPPTQSTSLYQRPGDKQATQAVVDDFVWLVRADSPIKQGRA